MLVFLVAVAAVGAVALMLAWNRVAADRRPWLLRGTGLVLMAAFTFVAAFWIGAEMLVDPGGWLGAGYVAMWLVPLLVLLAVCWYRLVWATVLLSVLTAVLIGIGVWFVLAPEAWRGFEDAHGPVRAIASFVLAAPLAVLGWRRPLPAGVLLMLLGVVPPALSAGAFVVVRGSFAAAGSLVAVSVPSALTGALYLIAVAIAARAGAPAARDDLSGLR